MSDDPDIVAFYAETALSISTAIRSAARIDIGRLGAGRSGQERAEAIGTAVRILDQIITPHFAWVLRHTMVISASPSEEDKNRGIQNDAKFKCALIWKGYLRTRQDAGAEPGPAETVKPAATTSSPTTKPLCMSA